jgi:nitrate reductase gamma subunit
MIPEILFLRGVREENRRLWEFSFPFHFGLYLLLATVALLIAGAGTLMGGGQVAAGETLLSSLIYYLTILTGFLGLTLGAVGSAGLIYRRASDPGLRNYSSGSDYFNLAFFFLFFVCGLLAGLLHDPGLDGARAYIYSLLTLGGQPAGYMSARSFLGGGVIVLASTAIAYIPMTHMAHSFMKYFMYHGVRWEDRPNLRGSKVEEAVMKNLGFKPTWSAPHIGADGERTWADLAASGSVKKAGKEST